jgi:hypothetical protein
VAISVNWGTKVISVPQSYLTHIGGSLYELDTDQFRLDLKDLEDSEEGMPFPDTHRHNTEVVLSGVTYARTLEIINGYTITFENGSYRVRLAGSNNNIADVANLNSVSILSQNSAGLISVDSGAGDWTTTEKAQIRSRLGIDGAASAPAATPVLPVTLQPASINDAAFAADARRYQAKVWMTDSDGDSKDRYVAAFFRDSHPVASGISSVTIQVIRASNGSDLVGSTAMTEIGSTGTFKHDESASRMVSGQSYVILVSATIDSAVRTWRQPMSRDSV